MLDAIVCHPVFLSVFAMAVAGGIILITLIKFGQKWFGSTTFKNGDLNHIKSTLSEIKMDLRAIKEFETNCQLNMIKNFVNREEWKEWKDGRHEIWTAINILRDRVQGG
jgi:hypothetical protein